MQNRIHTTKVLDEKIQTAQHSVILPRVKIFVVHVVPVPTATYRPPVDYLLDGWMHVLVTQLPGR